jgi:hypothetical protein
MHDTPLAPHARHEQLLGTSGGRPFKLLQDRGQTFRDGLLDGIQLGPERSPDCQQPRHSPCALIKSRSLSTTFPLLLASSMKLRGINGHDNLDFAIIFEGRTLCDSSPNASAQYISASFRYRRPSAQRFCNHQTSVLSRFSSIIFDLRPHRKRFRPHGRPRTFCFRLTCRCKTLFRALPYFQGWRMGRQMGYRGWSLRLPQAVPLSETVVAAASSSPSG